jgi:modification methylase
MSKHIFIQGDSAKVKLNQKVQLILTSPPYPMIEMWDECFSQLNPLIRERLDAIDGKTAWLLMTNLVNQVLTNCSNSLDDGGFLIVNIGDATRTVGDFKIYPTQSLIDYHCIFNLNLDKLPSILWCKPSNKPNKYMGSGMLPAGAYVTHEHEHVLIYRKGRRKFQDKSLRSKSAFFWEERNKWFSELWDIKGAAQKLEGARERSAVYPYELAYRLIAMYSCEGDTVLDPYVGLGTTQLAAMGLKRDSIGIDIEGSLIEYTKGRLENGRDFCNDFTRRRLERHVQFVKDRTEAGKPFKHYNDLHDFPVMTSQETKLHLEEIYNLEWKDNHLLAI